MATMDEDDPAIAEALSLAEAYNQRLSTGLVSLSDPYASDSDLLYGDTISKLMDVTGSGIIGVVDIPRIGVSLPIFFGTRDSDLQQGVGILEYTSLPIGGESTHSVLCAHSGLSSARLFSDLPNMEMGDIFYIHVLGLDLAYQVDQMKTVLPEDVSQIGVTAGEDYCTLLTCVPYGINTHRLLVRGTRVDYVEQEPEQAAQDAPVITESIWLKEYLVSIRLGIVFVGVLLLLWWGFVRLKRRKHGTE